MAATYYLKIQTLTALPTARSLALATKRANAPPPAGTAPAGSHLPSSSLQTVDPSLPHHLPPPASSSRPSSPPQLQIGTPVLLDSAQQISWSSGEVSKSAAACVQQQIGNPGCGCEAPGVFAANGRSHAHGSSVYYAARSDGRRRRSYKDVLLQQSSSGCHEAASWSLAPLVCQDGCPKTTNLGSEDCSCREDWQVVRPRRLRLVAATQADSMLRLQMERRALYLSKMKGLFFNYLAPDHKVAACCNPTKCWACHRSGHISTRCPSRVNSANSTNHVCSIHKHACFTRPLVGNKQPDAASPELLFGAAAPSQAQREPAEDPMWLEADLACRQQEVGQVKVEQYMPTERLEVKQSEVKLFDTPEKGCNQAAHESPEDSQTPLLLRSEEEQSIGHQLIKALSNLKHNAISSMSFSTLYTSSKKKKVVVGSKGKHRFIRKPRRSGIKVVRDMLTKKWIFVKTDKKLDDLTLNPFSASNFEAMKKLSEMVLVLEAIRKFTKATTKGRKKRNNDKCNSAKC